ncbi:MAG: phosphotransferase [Anaerolineae bacterium]|nr:phosphotransferase [Anaerolineae bacterium]
MTGGIVPRQYYNDDNTDADNNIRHLLRLAFGHHVDYSSIPVVAGTRTRGIAYALYGEGVPPQVRLLSYRPSHQPAAFRAFKALHGLHQFPGHTIPVPEVYYMGWSVHTNHVLLLLEQVAGRSIEELDQQRAFFGRVGPHFATTLAQLHRLQWQAMPGLVETPFHFAFRKLTRMIRPLETPQLHQILNWLGDRAGRISEMPRTVIHGDYTLPNIVARNRAIVAVQGWDNAVIADPGLDVGYASAALGAIDPAMSEQFVQQYNTLADPVAELQFWEVFGALRLLTRVARTISTLPPTQRERFLEQVQTDWNGLLDFVELRTGLTIQ